VLRYPERKLSSHDLLFGQCNRHFTESRYAMLRYAMPYMQSVRNITIGAVLFPGVPLVRESIISIIISSEVVLKAATRDPLISIVVSPVNSSNINVAVSDLSKRIGRSTPFTALRQKGDIRASRRGLLSLSLAENLHSGPEWQGIVAGVESGTTHDAQLRDGVGELGHANTGLALAGINTHALLAAGVGWIDGDAGGEERAAFVGKDIGGAIPHVGRGAVDVEDAPCGSRGIGDEHGEVLAGADVVGGHDEVVDRGSQVVGSDVSYQAEVGGSCLGRVDGGRSGWGSRGDTKKGQDAGEGQS
jgi:hypothetical protein